MFICVAAVPGCPGPQFAKDTRQNDARPVCLLSQAGTSANGGNNVMFTLSFTTEDTPLQLILWYRVYHLNDDSEALISYKVFCVSSIFPPFLWTDFLPWTTPPPTPQ